MERHDPLATGDSPTNEIPVAKVADRKVRTRKPRGLLHELSEVKDETLAFLYAGADQRPADYERSLDDVARIRHDFTAFCEGNPHFPNWRAAWTSFRATQREVPGVTPPTPPIPTPTAQPPLQTPAIPVWRQRLRRQFAYAR